MSLWLVLILVLGWLAIAGMVVALCVMAGRTDRRDEAFSRMRRRSPPPDRPRAVEPDGQPSRGAAEAHDVKRDATG